MNKFIFIAFCLPGINSIAQNNAEATGLIYGTNYAFMLTAPKGWVLDNKIGQPQHLSAVFYPKGESWENAITAMYTTTWTLKPKETITDVIKADAERERNGNANIKINTLPNVKLQNNITAFIREIPGDKNGNYELIAYISERNFMALIVMTSRTKQDLEKKKNKFYELVKSYKLSMQK